MLLNQKPVMTLELTIFHSNPSDTKSIINLFNVYLPQCQINEKKRRLPLEGNASISSKCTNILFLNPFEFPPDKLFHLIEYARNKLVILLLDKNRHINIPLSCFKPLNFLYLPIDKELLFVVLEQIKQFILSKQEKVSPLLGDKIAIPFPQGLEYVKISDIIRCEGMESYTKVVLTDRRKAIISSYNIGKFKSLLNTEHFFCPHKSHLINLNYIKTYLNEGTILMCGENKANIPVARAKREQFLNLIARV